MIIGYARVSTEYQHLDAQITALKAAGAVFASIAQFERDRISERTKEGLTVAHKRGRVGGRPPALSAERCAEVARMRDHEGRGIADLDRLFRVSTSTIRRV